MRLALQVRTTLRHDPRPVDANEGAKNAPHSESATTWLPPAKIFIRFGIQLDPTTNPEGERLIETLRRECLGRLLILNERLLQQIPGMYSLTAKRAFGIKGRRCRGRPAAAQARQSPRA